MDALIKKSEDGKLTEADIDNFKKTVDEYFVLQGELKLGTTYIKEVREDNKGIFVRR